MMHFDIKKLKDRIVHRLSKNFNKNSNRDDEYDELPGSSKRSLKNGPKYDVPPSGVRPVRAPPPPELRPPFIRIQHSKIEEDNPEREWFKTENGPELWDPEETLDMMFDELINEDKLEQRPDSTVLIGEYDPKHFLDQVPPTDTSGNELPLWKRMLVAKQVAEKAYSDMVEKRKKEELEAKYKDMPVWKREILRKKEEERMAVSGHVAE